MKKIFTATLILDFILMILNIVQLVHEVFFRDVYPTILIKDEISYFFWISIFLTVIIFVLMLRFRLTAGDGRETSAVRVVGVVAFFVLLIANIFFGYRYYNTIKPYKLSATENQDYMSSEYFRGISLDELQQDLQADTPILIYIGREDCDICNDFEEKLERILKDYSTEMPTYYTSEDREGERREEMYQVLDTYNVESVPTVIWVQDSKVLKIWNNPIDKIDEIKRYL